MCCRKSPSTETTPNQRFPMGQREKPTVLMLFTGHKWKHTLLNKSQVLRRREEPSTPEAS